MVWWLSIYILNYEHVQLMTFTLPCLERAVQYCRCIWRCKYMWERPMDKGVYITDHLRR